MSLTDRRTVSEPPTALIGRKWSMMVFCAYPASSESTWAHQHESREGSRGVAQGSFMSCPRPVLRDSACNSNSLHLQLLADSSHATPSHHTAKWVHTRAHPNASHAKHVLVWLLDHSAAPLAVSLSLEHNKQQVCCVEQQLGAQPLSGVSESARVSKSVEVLGD